MKKKPCPILPLTPKLHRKEDPEVFQYLQADRTTLWALTEVSSQTRVQSTNDSFCRRASKALRTWLWWLFHLSE